MGASIVCQARVRPGIGNLLDILRHRLRLCLPEQRLRDMGLGILSASTSRHHTANTRVESRLQRRALPSFFFDTSTDRQGPAFLPTEVYYRILLASYAMLAPLPDAGENGADAGKCLLLPPSRTAPGGGGGALQSADPVQ